MPPSKRIYLLFPFGLSLITSPFYFYIFASLSLGIVSYCIPCYFFCIHFPTITLYPVYQAHRHYPLLLCKSPIIHSFTHTKSHEIKLCDRLSIMLCRKSRQNSYTLRTYMTKLKKKNKTHGTELSSLRSICQV